MAPFREGGKKRPQTPSQPLRSKKGLRQLSEGAWVKGAPPCLGRHSLHDFPPTKKHLSNRMPIWGAGGQPS